MIKIWCANYAGDEEVTKCIKHGIFFDCDGCSDYKDFIKRECDKNADERRTSEAGSAAQSEA